MKRNTPLCLFCLLALLSLGASAQPVSGPGWHRPPPVHNTGAEAAAVVRSGLEQLITFMNSKPRPTGMKLAAFLEDKVASRFDFSRMARMSMGPSYRHLSPEQRADLEQKIEQHLLQSLTRRLAGFDQQRVRFFRPRRAGMHQAVVTVGIANQGSYPSRFDFRLHQGPDGWKVYDVVANGRSALAFYRQSFTRAWGAVPSQAYSH